MGLYLTSINLYEISGNFLECKDIINFSLTNKYFYSKLNPKNNPYVNSKFRDYFLKKCYNINNEKNFKQHVEYYLDDYKMTKNNWKEINEKIYDNKMKYPRKEISEEVYKSFYSHIYFPYQRAENKILEYKNNTLHQLEQYDANKNELILNNYYAKYFGDNEFSSKDKIEPLKKGLFFEEELINFKSEKKDYDNKKIIKFITTYSYQELDNIYYSIITSKNSKKYKKKKKKINSVLLFIIWLNHTFILFIDLLYKYVNQFSDFKNEKKLIIEYNKTHTNLINFGLLIDEKFNNVNIIINLLQKGNSSTNDNFKIYSMFMNIMRNNFYIKLKPKLNKNIGKIFDLLYDENFNKEQIDNYEENNIESTETVNEENEIENYSDDYLNDSICEDCDMEYEEESFNDDKLSSKEIFEENNNLILDFSINKDNANYINHSQIKLNEFYNQRENFVLDKFSENIQKTINNLKNEPFKEAIDLLNVFFLLNKRMFSENDGIKTINRTKLKMVEVVEKNLLEFIDETLDKQFKQDLKNNNILKNFQENKDNFILKDYNFKNKYNKIVYRLYTNKIYKIKENLVNNNLNAFDDKTKEQFENIVDNYLISNNRINLLFKDIIIYFCNQIYLYDNVDNRICEKFISHKDDKLFKFK